MSEKKLIPFDINKIDSHEIVTRDGGKIRIICTDVKSSSFPLVCLTRNEEIESVITNTLQGKYYSSIGQEHPKDLFMVAKTKKLYIKIDTKDNSNGYGRYSSSNAYETAVAANRFNNNPEWRVIEIEVEE